MATSLSARATKARALPPWVRSALVLSVDALLTVGSLALAVLLRFEGTLPARWLDEFERGLPLLLAIRLISLAGFGLHRWSFHGCSLNEAGRLVLANAAATFAFVLARLAHQVPFWPRSVVALEFLITTALLGLYRYAPRMAWQWALDRHRAHDGATRRALIVGAGYAGELLLHDLERSVGSCYHVVGLVDDDPVKHGTFLHGKPVFGEVDRLPVLIARHAVSQVLIAVPRMDPERIRHILGLCRKASVSFKIMPSSFTDLEHQLTAAMLHDLSPEHLLPRDPVAFDRDEVRHKVAGRRVLVTGAGGSIGSELARQLAEHGPAALVLLDLNENELYFLTRQLQERHPTLPISAVVADIRDLPRLLRLGAQHAPDYVFHAAAHKHVPLMEYAPEEAVKNNVFGTLNVAQMADACGAERMVLISTDKAVHPSSVMGASKRLAELIIRDVGARSRTHFTAVRFGNVLGSAGSVVPLFKQQIARGGPVTVTHPDCTRFFMTIPEAVGLVLLAGLGGYGELCILDMGAPVRIAELATNMITLAGRVPGRDIPIVFTGLRPGEKLEEKLLTEEEECTQQVRRRIKVAQSPPPPVDLQEGLERLWHAAQAGDGPNVKRALRALVPTYAPDGLRVAERPAHEQRPAPAPPPPHPVALVPPAPERGRVRAATLRMLQVLLRDDVPLPQPVGPRGPAGGASGDALGAP